MTRPEKARVMVGPSEEEGSGVLTLKIALTGNEATLFRAAAHRAQCTPDELLSRMVNRLFDELAPAPRGTGII